MRLQYSLGIKKSWGVLATMQCPGLYWINADDSKDAEHLCKQVISTLSPDAKAALIHSGIPVVSLRDAGIRIHRLPIFNLPQKKSALQAFTSDVMKVCNPRHQLLIVYSDSGLWQLLSKEQLQNWVQETFQWVNKTQCTLLILNHGPGSAGITQSLTSHHRYLDGLSRLQWQQDTLHYNISWWGTENGLSASQMLQIASTDSWDIQPGTAQQSILSCNDEFLYLAEKNIFEKTLPPSENWTLVENNRQLLQEGAKYQAATLIFSLYENNKIETLARKLFTLRQQCGNALKIVVREMTNTIRHSDESLLLGCGANLIVPFAVTLSKFLVMVESIQGQRFMRQLPENVDVLLTGLHPLPLKGYLLPDEFCKAVLDRMSNLLLPENGKGVLVALKPESGVPLKQVLSLCELQRVGDIVTIMDNHLFLFLSTSSITDLDITLNCIFIQPVDMIFSSHRVWDRDLRILTEIKQHTLYQGLLSQEVPLNNHQPKVAAEQAVKKVGRIPVEITLDVG